MMGTLLVSSLRRCSHAERDRETCRRDPWTWDWNILPELPEANSIRPRFGSFGSRDVPTTWSG